MTNTDREEYSVDAIYALRLSPFRAALGMRAMMASDPTASKITEQEFDRFVSAVRQSLPNPARFNREVENVRAALATGKADCDPDIEHAETQLLWGAALLLVHTNQLKFNERWTGKPLEYLGITQTPLWAQVTQTAYAQDEIFRHAFVIAESMRNPDTRFDWGAPGSTFFYNPDGNYINIDLVTGLVLGLEHTRAINLHEIGHSQMTLKFPKRQREIYAEMEVLEKKIDAGDALEPEEYKRLRMLSAEWGFRHRLFDAAENNCVNRNATVLGEALGQEFGYSLNHSIALISEEGQHAAALKNKAAQDDVLKNIFNRAATDMDALVDEMLKNTGAELNDENRAMIRELLETQRQIMDEMMEQQKQAQDELKTAGPDAHAAFINTIRVVAMAFYQNNGMIENTMDGWHKLGIFPEWISAQKPDGAPVNDNHDGSWPHSDFAQLLELCSGQMGLENLRPTLRDRWYGRDYFNNLSDQMADRRNEITEKIWDLYLDRYVKELMQQVEQQIDKEQEQAKNGQDQQGQQGQQQQGGGQPQQGQGQDQQGQGQQQQGDGQGQSQPQQGGGEFDPSKAGTNKDGKKIKVKTGKDEQTAEMPDVERPPEKPQKDAPGQEKDGQGNDKKDGAGQGKSGKTLQEILDDIKKRQEEAARKRAAQEGQQSDSGGDQEADEDGEDADGDSGSKGASKGGEGRTLEEIVAKSDWSNYPAIVAQLMGLIMQVAKVLEKIKEKQLQTDTRRARTLEMLPEDKELDRLDRTAHQDLIIKQQTGQHLEDRDLERFQKDEKFDKPAQIDIVILIDGSMSMDMGKGFGKITPLEASLTSATILYEAAKRVGANVYINLWGGDNPVMLAKPGDDSRTIAKNISAGRRGLGTGTELAPSIRSITAELAKHSGKGEPYRGYTHIIVLSDGDIDDLPKSQGVIESLIGTVKHVTLDFAVIRSGSVNPYNRYDINGTSGKTAMETLADRVSAGSAAQKIGIIVEEDPAKIPAQIVALLLDKIKKSESFRAIPADKKKGDFRRAQIRMEP